MKHRILTPAARRRVAQIHATIARLYLEQARLARLGLAALLLFAPAVISEGAEAEVRTAAENAGGQGRRPCGFFLPILAELPSVTETAMLGFLITGAGILLAIYQRVNSVKRDFMGEVMERVAATAAEKLAKQDVNIIGQPIKVQPAAQFITHPELTDRLAGYALTEDLNRMEKSLLDRNEANFRELDRKRSASIGNLHEHLTDTTKVLTEKITEGDAKMHDRLEAMSTSQRAEFDGKLSELRGDITELPGRIITLLQQTGQIGGTK